MNSMKIDNQKYLFIFQNPHTKKKSIQEPKDATIAILPTELFIRITSMEYNTSKERKII